MGSKDRVWEVFRQEAEGDPMVHGGSVKAPDEELATHYAREFYGRRQESERLWIVPRDAITELDDPDLLKPPFDRSFKRPGGFLIKHKLRRPESAPAARRSRRRGSERPGSRDPRCPGRAAAGDGRRRVRARLLGLRVDRASRRCSRRTWP